MAPRSTNCLFCPFIQHRGRPHEDSILGLNLIFNYFLVASELVLNSLRDAPYVVGQNKQLVD